MKTTNAQRCKQVRDKKRLLGLKKIEVFIADNEEAKAELFKKVAELNKRFNCINFK